LSDLPESGIWSVYIRRVHSWFAANTNQDGTLAWFSTSRMSIIDFNGNTPSSSTSNNHTSTKRASATITAQENANLRDWWVSFIITPTDEQASGKVMKPIHISGIAHDSTSVGKHPRNYTITPTMILAVLSQAMEVIKTRPIALHFWPALYGAFRMQSVHSLISAFESYPDFPSDFDLYAMELQDPPPHIQNSATCYIDPRTKLVARNHNSVIESNLSDFEVQLYQTLDRAQDDRWEGSVSATAKCMTQTTEISQLNLRRLFKASSLFHDTCSGVLAPNLYHWNKIKVMVETFTDDDGTIIQPKTWILMVKSTSEGDQPLLCFFNSIHDFNLATGKGDARTQIEMTSLLFNPPQEISFLLLDHILELGLQVPNDSCTYPHWCRTKCSFDDIRKSTLKKQARYPPKLEDMPSLAFATMAIAKLATNPSYNHHNFLDNYDHKVNTEIQLKVDGSGSREGPMKLVNVRLKFDDSVRYIERPSSSSTSSTSPSFNDRFNKSNGDSNGDSNGNTEKSNDNVRDSQSTTSGSTTNNEQPRFNASSRPSSKKNHGRNSGTRNNSKKNKGKKNRKSTSNSENNGTASYNESTIRRKNNESQHTRVKKEPKKKVSSEFISVGDYPISPRYYIRVGMYHVLRLVLPILWIIIKHALLAICVPLSFILKAITIFLENFLIMTNTPFAQDSNEGRSKKSRR